MKTPPNARRRRGRPPVDDDPLAAYRQKKAGRGGGGAADSVAPPVVVPDGSSDTADVLATFRAKNRGMHPADVPAVAPESTGARPIVMSRGTRTIGPRVLDDETSGERNVGRAAALYQGLTFGAGDKIQAGIQTLLPEMLGGSKGWDFKGNLRATRGRLDDYRARHPIESTVAELAGGVPTAVASAPLSLTAKTAQAGRAARLAALAGDGAIAGGISGGLETIGPDATLRDVGRGAGIGAGAGAVLGPVIGAAAAPVIRGGTRLAARMAPNSVADRLAGLGGGAAVTPRGTARDMIRGALESGGVDIDATAKTAGLIPPSKPAAAAPAVPASTAPKFQFREWPKAGARTPEGLDIGTKIDNTASIGATFNSENDYREVGVRLLPIEGEVGPNSLPTADARTRRLAEEIKANNRIDPLIWVDDPTANTGDGGYILEGSHRIDALRLLGHKSFPALVVQDLESAAKATAGASASKTVAPMAGRAANDEIRAIADTYRKTSGVAGDELPHPAKVDAEKAGVMANAYATLKNDPSDPEVIAAYRALAKETREQADALMKAGYKPEFMTDDPYKDSAEMMKDLADRKTIRVFKTNDENPHPLLSKEENDLFRWVHDVFGHGQSGNQFGSLGEERAFRDHASMFSPLARRAMATETRGQNSWVNFGPNKNLPAAERPFAEQKAAVMPPELMGDYGDIPRESPTTVMELGSRQVPSLVRAARNVPASTAAQTTDRFLTERAAGAGKRIERSLNEATGHEASDSWMPVEQFIQKRARNARPLYEEAESYGQIQRPETVAQIELLRKHPTFARAWQRGQALGRLEAGEEASAIGDAITPEKLAELQKQGLDKFLPPAVRGNPTVKDINRWKKGLDAVISSGYGSENALSREEARVMRQKLNDVLGMVDEEVPAFKAARDSYRGDSELVEAADAGAKHFAPSTPTGALERSLGAMTPGEREAYTTNALNKLVEQIRRAAINPDLPEAGRSTNILSRIMGTEDAGQRLGMLFPDESAFETFLRQVEDEALYPKTDRFLRNQSTTHAQQQEGKMTPQTWRDLAMSPFSRDARWRLARHVAEGAMSGDALPPKVANEVGELATATGYRLRALLQEMSKDRQSRELGRRRLLAITNVSAAAGAGDAQQRFAPPPE